MALKIRRPYTIDELVDILWYEEHHESFYFPENSNETVTLTAGVPANTFSAWAEIVDNNAVTFSSKATAPMHITALQIEDDDTDEEIYVAEIAYGAAKVVIARHRFGSGTKAIGPMNQVRFRPLIIPAGEVIYYRMKCETAGAIAVVSFRYHLH